jgi:signal transduction histidine kinase
MDPSNQQSVEEMNQQLVRQYTELAQLAGGLAHEIKNPLSTIRLNMELLAEDLAEPRDQRERRVLNKLLVVQRECDRLQRLLDDFLSYSKVRQVRLEPTDLNAVVAESITFFTPQAIESQIEIISYLDPELPRVMLDREIFASALLNLMINAQQAMKEGGQLILRTSSRGNLVSLDVIDTGIGLDTVTAARIFEAFYSTKSGGSGLGLPTTARIVESHGGRISIQSELGQGTKFTIDLPVPARLTAVSASLEGSPAIVATGPRRNPKSEIRMTNDE